MRKYAVISALVGAFLLGIAISTARTSNRISNPAVIESKAQLEELSIKSQNWTLASVIAFSFSVMALGSAPILWVLARAADQKAEK